MARDISPADSRGRVEAVSDETELRMWQWASAYGEQRLITHGLGSCIGLAVLNHTNRQGYLGHLPAPAAGDGQLEEMTEQIVSDRTDGDVLSVWIGGGYVPVRQPEKRLIAAGRDMVTDTIRRVAPEADVTLWWTEQREHLMSMVLDIGSATCQFVIEDDVED